MKINIVRFGKQHSCTLQQKRFAVLAYRERVELNRGLHGFAQQPP